MTFNPFYDPVGEWLRAKPKFYLVRMGELIPEEIMEKEMAGEQGKRLDKEGDKMVQLKLEEK